MVLKRISDVVYRIQSERHKANGRRKRLVVHINRLKLCHPGTVEVGTNYEANYHGEMSSKEDNDVESIAGCTRRQDELTDDEDGTTVIIPQQELHDGSFSQPALEESQRGGEVWGGRLRSIVNPPEFLTFQLRTGSSKEGIV